MQEPNEAQTLGAALLDLKDRSGLTLAQIAQAAGYRSASAIQRFFNQDYSPSQPNRIVGRRLAAALGGRGQPPIEEAEVLRLYGDTKFLKEVDHTWGGGWITTNDTIPITTAQWVAEGIDDEKLSFLEVFTRKASGTVIKTPSHLQNIALAGFFTPVSNMWPKYEVGQFVVFDGTRPVRAGDCVVARFSRDVDLRFVHFIARIDKIETSRIFFSQFNPERQFDLSSQAIDFMARLVNVEDLLPPIEAKQMG
ncbi:hypothetical protein ACQHGV_13540 [Sphingomonas pseudosanguinis]|uniref:hypothetical protein n=1 Tax=Sphingomonas pseudosanguinis TaxID=413712 RepID=UPI003F83CE66